jgi:hypothetical protein
MLHEHPQFLKTPRVHQQINSLAGCQFAFGVLSRESFLPSPLMGLCAQIIEAFSVLLHGANLRRFRLDTIDSLERMLFKNPMVNPFEK